MGVTEKWVTRAAFLATLADLDAQGISARQLAQALGVAESRVSAWKSGTTAKPKLRPEELARAVAAVTGTPSGDPLDPRSYTAGLLVGIEGDALAILSRIAEARRALGLTGGEVATPSVPASVRGVRAVAQHAPGAGKGAKRQPKAG